MGIVVGSFGIVLLEEENRRAVLGFVGIFIYVLIKKAA